jgi:RNA polymerase sigma-70 factor, ECF subfamily
MGDRRSDFDRVALVHLSELLRVAVRVCGERATAEDLVQETYLQAWRSFDRFEPGTNCRAWLYKILFYVHWQRRRKVTREPPLLKLDEAMESRLRFDPPTPDGLTAGAVKAAYDRLPGPFREVVLLTDVEELTYREAAEVLGVPIGTVMSRVSRARRLLRHELAAVGSAYFEAHPGSRKAGHRDS